MWSLSDSGQVHRWATRLHRLQGNTRVVYGASVGAILFATLIRWALGGVVHDRIPFTTSALLVVPCQNRDTRCSLYTPTGDAGGAEVDDAPLESVSAPACEGLTA